MKTNTAHPRIPDSVLETIESEKLLKPGDSVLAAVSGGADSTVLLHILKQLAPSLGLTLAVAHLNHGLRGLESDGDQAFVERLAENLSLSCYTEKTDVNALRKVKKRSLEEAARDARLGFLLATAERQGFTKIATAHHADDNAELFLLNLFRGSGPTGLKTMGASGQGGRVIRPLIGISRKDILTYAEANGLAFRTDSSNTDRAFLRNKIRHDLLPLLNREYQNGICGILNRTASILRDDDTYLDEITEPLFTKAVVEEHKQTLCLSVPLLASYPRAALRRVIRKDMEHVKGDLRRLTFFHTETAAALVFRDGNIRSLDFPGRLRVIRKDGLLVFRLEDGPLRRTPLEERVTPEAFEHRVPLPGPEGFRLRFRISQTRSVCFFFSLIRGEHLENLKHTGPETAFLDLSRLDFPLVLRNARSSDRFRPLGMEGRKKPPGTISILHQGPPLSLPCLVLVSGDAIVWVCGHRVDDRFKWVPSTENVLKIELFLD